MAAAGLFDGQERVELLEGELVVVSPQSPVHTAIMDVIAGRLAAACEPTQYLRHQSPLECGVHSAPEPDLALVVGSPRDYLNRHPVGAECALAVEVAVTSQPLDRAKAAIYARAGVAEYWLVDVPGRCLICHLQPDGVGSYGVVTTLASHDLLKLGGSELRVADLLP